MISVFKTRYRKATILLALLTVLVFVAFLNGQSSQPSPNFRNGNTKQNSPSSKFQEYPYNGQEGTESSPFIVQVKPQPTSDVETAAIQKKKTDDANAQRWGITIALLGIVIAGGQTYIFKRQLEIFRRQTQIQEAMMGQWIDMCSWTSAESPHKLGLDISFQLTNPTEYLLTLKHGEMAFEVDSNTSVFFVYRKFPLPPHKPLTIKTFVALNELKINTFKSGNFGMSVEGKICFINALKEEIWQHFSGILSCSESKTMFESSTKLIPSKDEAT